MEAKFIAFEGITGSGKKTHIKILTDRLRQVGVGVMNIAFPNYETDIARLTKRAELDPFTLSLLYAADRSLYQERIKALLERGTVVISDRYCYSNFAYQSARGIDLEWLKEIEKNVIKPHLVILIDLPVEMSMRRVEQASIEDFTKQEVLGRLERERDFMERIREAYLKLARYNKEAKWVVVDGSQDLKVNQEQIWDAVKNELGL